jgi:hypothetical protein
MIDQKEGIIRSVAAKAATEIFTTEVGLGAGSVPLAKWDAYYDHILARMTEEQKHAI